MNLSRVLCGALMLLATIMSACSQDASRQSAQMALNQSAIPTQPAIAEEKPYISEAQQARLEWLKNEPATAAMTSVAPMSDAGFSNAEGAQ